MTQIRTKVECPVGTVITLGHPANLILAVKTVYGTWRYVDDGELVDYDTHHKADWDIYALPKGYEE